MFINQNIGDLADPVEFRESQKWKCIRIWLECIFYLILTHEQSLDITWFKSAEMKPLEVCVLNFWLSKST